MWIGMLLDNPLLIIGVIFGVGGWFVYRLATAPVAASTESEAQSENSASNRGA